MKKQKINSLEQSARNKYYDDLLKGMTYWQILRHLSRRIELGLCSNDLAFNKALKVFSHAIDLHEKKAKK